MNEPSLFDIVAEDLPVAEDYPPETPASVFIAHLIQGDPKLGDRGWRLSVDTDLDGVTWQRYRKFEGSWPGQRITRPGLRPPTIARRAEVLAELGFELVDGAKWSWAEYVAGDGKTVLLQALTNVRRIR